MVKRKKNKKVPKEIIKLKPKERLLKYLLEDKRPHSIMEASVAAVIDYKNTYTIVDELQSAGIINKEKIGNIKPIRINLVPNQEIYNVENKRTEEFLIKNPRLRLIQEDIKRINYPFLIALLFGSHAKDAQSGHSDIDICVISDSKDKVRELLENLRLLSLPLEIHEFTTKEFISMIEKTQNNIGKEIIKRNIILYGIENYYNLISKWMKKE